MGVELKISSEIFINLLLTEKMKLSCLDDSSNEMSLDALGIENTNTMEMFDARGINP